MIYVLYDEIYFDENKVLMKIKKIVVDFALDFLFPGYLISGSSVGLLFSNMYWASDGGAGGVWQ